MASARCTSSAAKTTSPVDHAEAHRIYEKLVKEKLQKGYTPGEEGAPYQQTGKQERATAPSNAARARRTRDRSAASSAPAAA